MEQSFKIANSEITHINNVCINDHKGQEYLCIFAETISDYIKIPFLMLQPGYDSWQINNILGENCINKGSISDCSNDQQINIQEYKQAQNNLVKKVLAKKTNFAVWCPACLTHCWTEDNFYNKSWAVPDASGNTINVAIEKFMKAGMEQTGNRDMDDEVDWPDVLMAKKRVVSKFLIKIYLY